MWAMIASLEPIVQALAAAFTPASFVTHGQFFLASILCLGKHRHGKGRPTCSELARQTLRTILDCFPHRRFTRVGAGRYAAKTLLQGLAGRLSLPQPSRGAARLSAPPLPVAKRQPRGPAAQ